MRHDHIHLDQNAICPCGSSRLLRDCCQRGDRFEKLIPSLTPPGALTGHRNSKCYLGETLNCSPDLSREHYLSRGILEAIGDELTVSGAFWLDGKEKVLSPDNLTARVLCSRHNNALSPLDDEASGFFRWLGRMDRGIAAINSSQRPRTFIASGQALELWLMKVTCGIYHSVGSTQGVPVRNNFGFDSAKAAKAFSGHWDAGAGLYFGPRIGQTLSLRNQAGCAPITNSRSSMVVGALLLFRGIQLEVFFDMAGSTTSELAGKPHRPTELIWQNGKRRYAAMLTWPNGVPARSIRLDLIARERHNHAGTTILPVSRT